MLRIILLSLILFFPALAEAQELPDNAQTAEVLDLPAPQEPYVLQNWDVVEIMEATGDVIRLYEGKPVNVFLKKYWVINKKDRSKKVTLEFATSQKDSRLIFSPQEDYVFYLSFSEQGRNIIQGVSLISEDVVSFATAEKFVMVVCPEEHVFIVSQAKTKGRPKFTQYSLNGEKVADLKYSGVLSDVDEVVCAAVSDQEPEGDGYTAASSRP